MEFSQVRSRWRWSVLCLLSCVAIVEFSARGPFRALGSNRDFNDFISPYAQTRVWLSGHDPYAASNLRGSWPVVPGPTFLVTESGDGTLAAKRGFPSPYLDIAFPLLLPIAELPWRIAIWVWVLLCLLGLFVLISILIRMSGVGRRSQLALTILVSALLLAPVHTAIAAANIVTVDLALGLLATFCLMQNRAKMAGVLLTLAIVLKPTIALPFVIYAVVYAVVKRDRVKAIGPAIATGVLLLCAAIIPCLLYTSDAADE